MVRKLVLKEKVLPARFSKNLPTAFENLDAILANLAKEFPLGCTAGPFDTPPFSNFQVSPIRLVPKKNSAKFRTIFHLSYPKSGSSSKDYHISKEDFSLQYVTTGTAEDRSLRSPIFIYSDSASLISFEIDCFDGL